MNWVVGVNWMMSNQGQHKDQGKIGWIVRIRLIGCIAWIVSILWIGGIEKLEEWVKLVKFCELEYLSKLADLD